MRKNVQLHASVSAETRALLEKECRATGIKPDFLVEAALLHHLQALQELPADVVIPPRLVVSAEIAGALFEQIEHPRPTQALRSLMRSRED